jgi:hypothetical protein
VGWRSALEGSYVRSESLEEPLGTPFLSHFGDSLVMKAEEEDGKWMVYMKASDELADQDGEVMSATALEKAKDYFLSHGVISWDHLHKIQKRPEYIIGEPLDMKLGPNRETFVKAFLYKENEIAKGVWNNIRSGAKRIGASVGGGILKKSEGGKRIDSVVLDEVALTHKPVNDRTYGSVSVVPFKVFMKALMAGAGVDAGSFTGGRALIGESLQGAEQESYFPNRDEQVDMFGTVLKAVLSGRLNSYRELRQHVGSRGYDDRVADRLARYIVLKMPSVMRHLK